MQIFKTTFLFMTDPSDYTYPITFFLRTDLSVQDLREVFKNMIPQQFFYCFGVPEDPTAYPRLAELDAQAPELTNQPINYILFVQAEPSNEGEAAGAEIHEFTPEIWDEAYATTEQSGYY